MSKSASSSRLKQNQAELFSLENKKNMNGSTDRAAFIVTRDGAARRTEWGVRLGLPTAFLST